MTKTVIQHHFKLLYFSVAFSLASVFAYAQEETAQDSIKEGYTFGKLKIKDPSNIQELYTYDPIIDRYIFSKKIGEVNISYPMVLTPQEYQDLVLKQQMKDYFKQKSDQAKDPEGEESKNLIPAFYVNNSFFESIFGGNKIEVIPQGQVSMDLGVLYSKQDNPSLSPRNQSNTTLDFDQRINMSLEGTVGTRVNIAAQYNTQSTFDFQNQIKLDYTPDDDAIVQSIEVGNVNMPLNSSLIQGAESLFGVKTQLKFGKTTITGVFSEMNSERQSVNVQGGGTVDEFDKFGLEYDENRHFFLSQIFRDEYDKALLNYPFINSRFQITRVQIWVTNRNNSPQSLQNARNIVAIQDLGESSPERIGFLLDDNGNPTASPIPNFITQPGALPDNRNNVFNPFGINGGGTTVLTSAIRDMATVTQGFGAASQFVTEGRDYGILENARQLSPNEFTLHPQLGYVSLNQRISNDEVLAVAYEYTSNGRVFKVGEFANDGVDSSQPTQNPNPQPGQEEQTVASNQNLVVKMLKSPITNVNEPIWDLMMKNIYSIGGFDIEQEGFRFNILYTDPQPVNFLLEPEGSSTLLPDDVASQNLLQVFNFDRLNSNGDLPGSDGFFDFVPGITIDPRNGFIKFTKVEPFGEFLFDRLNNTNAVYNDQSTWNENQLQFVFQSLYETTKTQAMQQEAERNKFQLRGQYRASGQEGIPIGAFNVPRGSVQVSAGGRQLQEGVDYVVNYELGLVQILDEALLASDTPIQVSTENNAVFGRQTKRFTGIDVQHEFSENFILGGTFLNMNERPLTQKSNYGSEPISNTMYGVNFNYNTTVPFFTRIVNKLPNIETEVESNFSIRGEFAYIQPGTPKADNFGGRDASYIDDFEASQTSISLLNPAPWSLSSVPVGYRGPNDTGGNYTTNDDISTGYYRAKLNWYTIDPIFYSTQRPQTMTDDDFSFWYSRRILINEIFPNRDIVPGQFQTIPTFDMVYRPTERGMYNYNPASASTGTLPNPDRNFGGIMRGLETTDFERSNVEFVEFWVMDPFIYPESAGNNGGKLVLNFGSISEDVLKDGRKQYENGLPENGGTQNTLQTNFAKVPSNQSLVYAFDTEGAERTNQDIGLDGFSNAEEATNYPDFANFEDPAGDDYRFYLEEDGDILTRYEKYNGVEGNNPVEVSQNVRGNSPLPDVEDVNRDNTMNTIDSYFEYEVPMYPGMSVDNNTSGISGVSEDYITDVKSLTATAPNGQEVAVRWVQFRVPLRTAPQYAIGGISDLRAIRFMRMYMTDFSQETILRLGSLDLVRGDYLTYDQPVIPNGTDPTINAATSFNVTPVSQEISSRYVSPPGVVREQLINNNVAVREDEQSLALTVKNLQPEDSRAVFKNFQVDMRQYRYLEMFLHAEALPPPEDFEIEDGDLVAFIRMGVDFTNNFYEVEIPLKLSDITSTVPRDVWPLENDLELDLELLQRIKATVLGSENFSSIDLNFFDEEGVEAPDFITDGIRVGIKGNPSFGNIRVLMLGVRNATNQNISGQVWFNELRVSELTNQGGWAAVLDIDTNIADFATFSGTASRNTIGFGSIDQGPNQRSLEDTQQYDFVTGVNVGQLLPKDWGVKIPVNYGRGEELVTPRFDPVYLDLELDNLLEQTEDPELREQFRERAESYTKRQSISIIGLRKDRTNQEKIPKPWDIENFTVSGTYNVVEHRDFEIQESLDQNLDFNANYAYNFTKAEIEPFKEIGFLNKSKYFDLLKDFNLNLLPTSLTASSSVIRQYSEVRFRELNLPPGSIGLPRLFQRNYFYNWQYAIDWDFTKNINVNFNASQNRIVRNFLNEDLSQDNSVGVWDGFFDVGVPNTHMQTLQVNYKLPFDKVPLLNFIQSNYSFTGDFQWQKGSEILRNLEDIPNIGNTIQNSSAHQLNNTFAMSRLYNYLGLKKKKATGAKKTQDIQRGADRRRVSTNARGAFGNIDEVSGKEEEGKEKLSFADHFYNFGISLLTMVDRIQINYTENRGTFIPGFTHDIGFGGTFTPTPLFTFGGQRDVRQRSAMNRWLTEYQEFNEQYMATNTEQLDFNASVKLIPGMTLDIIANRQYAETYTENFRVDRETLQYQSLTPNTFGNFSISTLMIGSAFDANTRENSPVFEQFRANRLQIARRLATEAGINPDDPENIDENGYPSGFGRTNQAVLLPAFLAAYTGQSAEDVSLTPFRSTPLPNWNFKYTGLMQINWFKEKFNRFSIQHGYQSAYTLNAFQSNLDYDRRDPFGQFNRDQNGNFKNELYISNMNLVEVFSPLVRVDFEMKNSLSILTEIKKDRTLSLSFDNNLLTEMLGNEYIAGLGYRIKDLRIVTQFEGKKRVLSSDLNLKLDVAYRRNETIIRALDVVNNRTTAGQDIWSINFLADYMITKQLTVIFFYDHIFTENAISTIFPQTTIRTGLTINYNFGN